METASLESPAKLEALDALPGFQVARVAATEMPQRLVYLALHNDYNEHFSPDTELAEDQCGRIAVSRLLKSNRGHYGPLEHPQLSLLIRADHNTIVQLRTHRVGCTFDVQSMRYSGQRILDVADGKTPVTEAFYFRPPGVYRDRQGDPYSWTPHHCREVEVISQASAVHYADLRDKGVSEEHARSVLTTNYFQNALVSGSMRFWLHLLDVRSKADAQLEIQVLMKMIAKEIHDWAPEIYDWYETHRLGRALLAP